MPTIQALGLETYYEEVGKGPTLLLLHGWANTWEAWMPVIPHLSDHFKLVMPDLPGCGKTQTPLDGWSTIHHAKWLESFIRAAGPTIDFIAGHSYGGKMLLEYCSGNYTPQPKKIVLLDASGIPAILTAKQKMLQTLASITPGFLKQRAAGNLREQLYNIVGADSDYLHANEFQKKTLQIILKEDYTSKLSAIGQATLLLWGKQDASTPLWQGESMHTLIPLNQLKTFECGHFPHHQYPVEVSTQICQFL